MQWSRGKKGMNRKWKSQARQKRPARMSFFACMMRFPLNLSHFHRRLLFCIFRFRGGGGVRSFSPTGFHLVCMCVCLLAWVRRGNEWVQVWGWWMDCPNIPCCIFLLFLVVSCVSFLPYFTCSLVLPAGLYAPLYQSGTLFKIKT